MENFIEVKTDSYGKSFQNKPTPFFRNGWKEIELPQFTDSKKEIEIIKKEMKKVTAKEKEQLKNQDKKHPPFELEFLKIVENSNKSYKEWFDNLTDQLFTICMYFKNKFNRKRPYEYAKENEIDYPKIKTETGVTPSYPSGHAMNSFFAAEILAKKHPEYRKELFEYAEKVAHGRVKLGVHYQSDVESGKLLAKKLLPFLKDNKITFKEYFQACSDTF